MGYVVLRADNDEITKTIYFSKNRCKLVTRYVLTVEVHALILVFDTWLLILDMLQDILGINLYIESYFDSQNLFYVVQKDRKTTKKCLKIDISSLRESYEHGELKKIHWIPGQRNPTECFTGEAFNAKLPLWQLLTTCHIDLSVLGCATESRENIGV